MYGRPPAASVEYAAEVLDYIVMNYRTAKNRARDARREPFLESNDDSADADDSIDLGAAVAGPSFATLWKSGDRAKKDVVGVDLVGADYHQKLAAESTGCKTSEIHRIWRITCFVGLPECSEMSRV